MTLPSGVVTFLSLTSSVAHQAGRRSRAAVESQRTLGAEAWEAAIADFTVRMGTHTGSGQVVNGDYLGSAPPFVADESKRRL
jgi:hypothetical protein